MNAIFRPYLNSAHGAYHKMQVIDASVVTAAGGALDGGPLAAPLSLGDQLEISGGGSTPGPKASEVTAAWQATSRSFLVMDGGGQMPGGSSLSIGSCLRFMDPQGSMLEVPLLEMSSPCGLSKLMISLPSNFRPGVCYSLVKIDPTCGLKQMAEESCLSVAEGTHIAMAGGGTQPVETLSIGDVIATGQGGASQVRWVGHSLTHALGDQAPIRINKGTFGSTKDVFLAPQQLLSRPIEGEGASELCKAQDLLDGCAASREPVNYIEYYYILLDSPQVFYAEGLPLLSLEVTPKTLPAIPEAIAANILQASARQLMDPASLPRPDMAPNMTPDLRRSVR